MVNEKKFLDYEGIKHLWSKINMNDYPNNATLIAIINAIDETKVDIELFLQVVELLQIMRQILHRGSYPDDVLPLLNQMDSLFDKLPVINTNTTTSTMGDATMGDMILGG